MKLIIKLNNGVQIYKKENTQIGGYDYFSDAIADGSKIVDASISLYELEAVVVDMKSNKSDKNESDDKMDEKIKVVEMEHFDPDGSIDNLTKKCIVTFSSEVNSDWIWQKLNEVLEAEYNKKKNRPNIIGAGYCEG